MWNQLVFSSSIKYFLNVPGITGEQNHGNQNGNKISQSNLENQASTSKNKSEYFVLFNFIFDILTIFQSVSIIIYQKLI